jgi:hypothetical protein
MEGRIRKATAGAQSHRGQAVARRTEPVVSVVALGKQRGRDLITANQTMSAGAHRPRRTPDGTVLG